MEHRWGHRVECQEALVIETAGGRFVSQLVSLSRTGAFLRFTERRLPRVVLIQFDRGCSGPHPIGRLLAYIVRESPTGVGLEWAEFSPPLLRELLNRIPRPRAAEAPPIYGLRHAIVAEEACGADLGGS